VLPGLVDDSHAAAPQFLQHLVTGDGDTSGYDRLGEFIGGVGHRPVLVAGVRCVAVQGKVQVTGQLNRSGRKGVAAWLRFRCVRAGVVVVHF
jgi:hypothetical protein